MHITYIFNCNESIAWLKKCSNVLVFTVYANFSLERMFHLIPINDKSSLSNHINIILLFCLHVKHVPWMWCWYVWWMTGLRMHNGDKTLSISTFYFIIFYIKSFYNDAFYYWLCISEQVRIIQEKLYHFLRFIFMRWNGCLWKFLH